MAIFAGEGLVSIVVEEEGDVRIFFGLGAAEILVLNVGKNLREDVFEFFGTDDVLEPRPILVSGAPIRG